jgi:hypothetical protein
MIKKEKEKYNWQWENSINTKRSYLEFDVPGEPKYEPRRTNKSFSNYPDTILQANAMNLSYHLDIQLQYAYLFYSIRKKVRKFKNHPSKKDEYFTLIQQYYKYNNQKTHEALAVLNEEQLEIIKRKMNKGGIK